MSEQTDLPSKKLSDMLGRAKLPCALMDGTDAIRKLNISFLPKHETESDTLYNSRIKNTFLNSFFRQGVKLLSNQLFIKKPAISLPSELEFILKDVDTSKWNFNEFIKSVFEDSLVFGVSYVLIDYSTVQDVLHLEDFKKLEARPYFVHISPKKVLDFTTQLVNNKITLTRFKILESSDGRSPQDFYQEMGIHTDNKELKIVEWSLEEGGVFRTTYGKQPTGAGGYEEIEKIHYKGINEIPIKALYTNRTNPYEGHPPLENLAYLNLEYFNLRSDQRSFLSCVLVPMLYSTGQKISSQHSELDADGNPAAPLKIQPMSMIISENENAKFGYLESSGKHLEIGRQELLDLKNQMEAQSMQIVSSQSETATGRAIDAENIALDIKAWSEVLSDFCEEIFSIAKLWMGLKGEDDVECRFSVDVGYKMGAKEEMDFLYKANAMGILSDETLLKELKNRRMLPSDFNWEEERMKVEKERKDKEEIEFAKEARMLSLDEGDDSLGSVEVEDVEVEDVENEDVSEE